MSRTLRLHVCSWPPFIPKEMVNCSQIHDIRQIHGCCTCVHCVLFYGWCACVHCVLFTDVVPVYIDFYFFYLRHVNRPRVETVALLHVIQNIYAH